MENQQPTKPDSNKTAIIIVVVIVVILSIAIAGYFIYKAVATKVTETGLEKLIESQTGQKIDIDKEGQTMKITTEEGEEIEYEFDEDEGSVNIKFEDDEQEGEFHFKSDEEGLDIPDKLKDAIPIFEPSTMITLNDLENLGVSGTFTTSKSPEDVKGFYLDKMEDKGWTKTGTFEIEDKISINFEKEFGSEQGTIMIYTADDKTHFLLSHIKQ